MQFLHQKYAIKKKLSRWCMRQKYSQRSGTLIYAISISLTSSFFIPLKTVLMRLRMTQGFIHVSNIQLNMQFYIIAIVIQFLQQISIITRFQNREEYSPAFQFIRIISLTALEDYTNNKVRIIVCYILTSYLGLLSIIQLLLMFCINVQSRIIALYLKIYFTSVCLLTFPYVSAVYSMSYKELSIIGFSICQFLIFTIYLISLKFIGQEILYRNSVQVFNQQAALFDATIKLLISIFSQSKSVAGKSYILILASMFYLVVQIFIPVHLDIYLYPIRVGLQSLQVLALFIYQSSMRMITKKLMMNITFMPIFFLTFYITQMRMMRVIENSICMLIIRRQCFHGKEQDKKFDIDYYYIPPFYLQLFGIFLYILNYIVQMVCKLLSLIYKNGGEKLEILFTKFLPELTFDDNLNGGLFIMQIKQSKNKITYALFYKNYVKTINRRLKFIKKQESCINNGNFKFTLGFQTVYDYNLVMYYIAKYYRQYYIHKLFVSEQVQNVFDPQIIDVEYLKHLQVITQTMYPTNKFIKLSYSIMLCQQLNDLKQAQYQLQAYQQLNVNNVFQQNIRFNQRQLRGLFGQTYIFDYYQEDDTMYEQNVGKDLYTKKIMDIVSLDVQNNTCQDNFKLINNIWDRLDNQFINLWSLTQYHVNLKNYYEFYEDYFNSMKILHNFKRNNNYFLYYTYEYAIKQYFLLEQQSKKLYQTYMMHLEKYNQGMNIPNAEEQFMIVNYDDPSQLYMKQIYGFPAQTTLLNQQYYQLTKTKAMQIQNNGTSVIYTDNSHELKLIKMKQQKLQEKQYHTDNLPTSKKHFYILFFISVLLFGIITALIILINYTFSFSKINKNDIEYITTISNNCNFLYQYKTSLEATQLFVNFPEQVRVQANAQQYFERIQQQLVQDFAQYTNKFKGNILLEDYFSDRVDYSFNRIFEYTKQLLAQLTNATQRNMLQMFKQFKYLYRSSVLYIIPPVPQTNILQIGLIEITSILFCSPLVFYFVFYNLDYLLWKNILYMVKVFKSIPSNIREEISDYFNQIKNIRIKQSTFDNENIFKFLNDVISFKFIQNKPQTIDNMKYMSINSQSSSIQSTMKRKNLRRVSIFYSDNQIYKKVLSIIYIINVFLLNLILIFLTVEQKSYDYIVINQMKMFQKIQSQTQEMRIKTIKHQYLHAFFQYNDTRFLTVYQEQNKTSFSNMYYYIQQNMQKLDVYMDVINIYTKLYYLLDQHQTLENIAFCKYMGQYNQCDQQYEQELLTKLQIPYGQLVDLNNYHSILNSSYAIQLQKTIDNTYKYIFQRVIIIEMIFPESKQQQFFLIRKMLKSILYKTQLEQYGSKVFYAPFQALHQQQYINQIQNISLDLDKTDSSYIMDYLNNLGLNTLQQSKKMYSSTDQLLTSFHLQMFNKQLILIGMQIVLCTLAILNQNKYKCIYNYLGTIMSIVVIVFSIVFHNETLNATKSHKIILSQNFLFEQINDLDDKITYLLNNDAYNESALVDALEDIYQLSSVYNFGQSDNAVPHNIIVNKLIQHYGSRIILMPLEEPIKRQIVQLINTFENDSATGEKIFQVDVNKQENKFLTAYQKIAFILQDHLKIALKIIIYYCKTHQMSISEALYNNNIFFPVKTALTHSQELLTYLDEQKLSIKHQYLISPQQFSSASNFYGFSVFNDKTNIVNAKFLLASYEFLHSKNQLLNTYWDFGNQLSNDINNQQYLYYYGMYMAERYSILLCIIAAFIFSQQLKYHLKEMLKKYYSISRLKIGNSKNQLNKIISEHNRLRIHDKGIIIYEISNIIMVICIVIQLLSMYQNQSQLIMFKKIASIKVQATSMIGALMCELQNMSFGCYLSRSVQNYHSDIQAELQQIIFPAVQEFNLETINQIENPLFFRFIAKLLYNKFQGPDFKSLKIQVPQLQLTSNCFLHEFIDYFFYQREKQNTNFNNSSIQTTTYSFLEECQAYDTNLAVMSPNEKLIQVLKTEQCVTQLFNVMKSTTAEIKEKLIYIPFIAITCAASLQLIYLILLFVNSIQSIKKNIFFKSIINKIPQHIMCRIYQLHHRPERVQ